MILNNKKSINKSMADDLYKDVNEFIRISKIFFEFLTSLTTNTPLSLAMQSLIPTFQQQSQSQLQPQLQSQQNINDQHQLQPNIATPQHIIQIMNYLINIDKDYQKTLKKLEKHQKYQTEITNIQKEIEEKDKLISGLALNLKDIESFLENELSQENAKTNPNISNASDILELNGDSATTTPDINGREITPEELISYAHKISGTTFAPYGYQPNLQLTPLFKPPAPQDEMIRASVLFTKPPPHVLKYYGLVEQDVTTPIAVQSPITAIDGTITPISNTKDSIDQQQQQQQQQPIQQSSDSEFNQQQQQQNIITPPQPQQQMVLPPQQLNIDLDLNPDLESDEDDEDDEEEESGDEEIEWD